VLRFSDLRSSLSESPPQALSSSPAETTSAARSAGAPSHPNKPRSLRTLIGPSLTQPVTKYSIQAVKHRSVTRDFIGADFRTVLLKLA
jgi:hypothetical protein